MAGRWRWWPGMEPSTGCACPTWIRPASSPRSSMPSAAAASSCAPPSAYETTRRYRPGTNVLETTFTTTSGSVRVTDAMTLPDANLGPLRELARRVEGLSGRVAMRWRATPRFDYGRRARLERRGEIPVASHGADGVAFGSWDAGAPEIRDGGVSGRFEMAAGHRALLGVIATCNEPLVFPPRAHVELGSTPPRRSGSGGRGSSRTPAPGAMPSCGARWR